MGYLGNERRFDRNVMKLLKGYGLFEFQKEKAEEERRMAEKEITR